MFTQFGGGGGVGRNLEENVKTFPILGSCLEFSSVIMKYFRGYFSCFWNLVRVISLKYAPGGCKNSRLYANEEKSWRL